MNFLKSLLFLCVGMIVQKYVYKAKGMPSVTVRKILGLAYYGYSRDVARKRRKLWDSHSGNSVMDRVKHLEEQFIFQEGKG